MLPEAEPRKAGTAYPDVNCPLTSSLPIVNRLLVEPRFGQMMGHQFGLGLACLRKPLF